MPERDRNGYVRNTDYDDDRREYSSACKNRRSNSSSENRDYKDYNSSRDRSSSKYRPYYGDRRSSKDVDDYYGRRGRGRDPDQDYYGREPKMHQKEDRSFGVNEDQRSSSKVFYDDNKPYARAPKRGKGRGDRDRDRYEDDDRDQDWKCKECKVWNYPDEKECSRCGLDRRQARQSSSSSHDEPDSRKSRKKGKSEEWPPCFEDSGDVFVLDSRSGMFYDSNSDFFYDPTSKLYYGNKKQAYFSYSGSTRTFVPVNGKEGEFQPAPPAGSSGAVNDTEQDHLMLVPNGANPNASKDAAGAGTSKIVVKLKTVAKADVIKKRKKRSESHADKKDPASKRLLLKQHAANMELWQERGKEKQRFNFGGTGRPSVTKQGKPICWVCERKFACQEKLELHESKSQLHEDNLRKQRELQETAKERKVVNEYVDRAQQRRAMYGPELVLPPAASGVAVAAASAVASETTNANTTTSSSSVGHQMLAKLGWKSGEALGRGSEEQQEQQAALTQDWDRIESLAAQNKNSGRQVR